METRYNIFDELQLKPLPQWSELPELDLYLDQVLFYVNKVSQTSVDRDTKGITASMVNNYVKHGQLEKPIKKKYQRSQVARLIAIAFLKNVFSLQEIGEMLDALRQDYESEDLYNRFVHCMNGTSTDVPDVISHACLTIKSYYQTRLLMLAQGEKSHESNL